MNVSPACLLRRSAQLCRLLCLGLLVLAGLCLALGVSVRPAHALSKFTVTNCSSDSQLQADVAQANSDNASDVITFACSGDIKLTGTLNITGNMTLSGSGQSVTLDGGNSVQVLLVNSVSLTLKALTIAHGSATDGGGLYNIGGTVSISNSTFAYNSTPGGGSGGGLFNDFQMTISNSTFANNSASNSGGGLYNNGGLDIRNGTLANNSASNGNGGGYYNDNQGSIIGSIVAANTGGDCVNASGDIGDWGYNLSSDSSCGFSGTGSVQNTDPKLGPLASNGGPTQTLALLKGSPASDAIPLSSGLCPATDQRGHKRPDNPKESACDLGAYES